MPNPLPDPTAIESRLAELVSALPPGKSLDPALVARSLAGDHPDQWGPLMQPVRRAAVKLAKAGRISILRKGRLADPDDFRGIYRLAATRHD
jgi:hypothetical protein